MERRGRNEEEEEESKRGGEEGVGKNSKQREGERGKGKNKGEGREKVFVLPYFYVITSIILVPRGIVLLTSWKLFVPRGPDEGTVVVVVVVVAVVAIGGGGGGYSVGGSVHHLRLQCIIP